jgi:hypothetical protein
MYFMISTPFGYYIPLSAKNQENFLEDNLLKLPIAAVGNFFELMNMRKSLLSCG